MKAKIILLIVVSLAFLAFLNYFFDKNNENQEIITQKILKIGEISLSIEVADTDAAKIQGLSGRSGLAENQGMLFIFEKPGFYGFWMKDMNFSIDMVWIDESKKIVHIESDVKPETYPKIFNSPVSSLYVLETAAGFLAENNVKIGDQVAF